MSCACAAWPARMASRTKTQETATHLRRYMRAPPPDASGSRSYFVGAVRAADEGRSARNALPASIRDHTVRQYDVNCKTSYSRHDPMELWQDGHPDARRRPRAGSYCRGPFAKEQRS
jgi:hypothetical protein